ncbi:MAG: hypothetical protein ACK5JD_11895 [Mangrovibacterium sp.]
MKVTRDVLKVRIAELEHRQTVEREAFNSQLKITFDSLKLSNLIRSSLREITQTTLEVKGNILEAALPLIANYVSGRIANKSEKSSFYQVLATVAQMALTNFTARHSHAILEIMSGWLDGFTVLLERMTGAAKDKETDS